MECSARSVVKHLLYLINSPSYKTQYIYPISRIITILPFDTFSVLCSNRCLLV